MSAKGAPIMAQLKDALKNQELPQRKPQSPEARRILSLYENCISQVEIAVTLPALLRLNSVSGVVNEELSRVLQNHQILEKRLETQEDLKLESGEEQEGEVRKAKAQLEKDIKNSFRDVLRVVRHHPDAISGLRTELGKGVGESEYSPVRALERFHTLVVKKLQTSPDEELQLVRQKQVSPPPVRNLERMASREEEAAAALKEVEAEISEMNNSIEKLRSRQKECKKKGSDVFRHGKKHCLTSEVMNTSTQQAIDQLESELNSLILKNTQEETQIKEKNKTVETKLECLLKTFDDEMEEIQANLERNRVEYEREEEELRTLEKAFSVLEVEYNQIQEKRRLAEEKRREEMRELELKTKAAIFAQAWWRGYSTRKALKNKDKSKKAKSKKGKKGKKTK